jgi:hypothetical protein
MKMMRRALLLGLLLCLAFGSSAQAAYDPVGGGTAKLVLARGFASFLKKDGILLKASQGAKRKGASYLLPIESGNLDPTIGKGEVKTAGTLSFEDHQKRVPLREITLKTKPQPLVAKVGGSQLKVASSAKRTFKRKGFDSTYAAKALALTSKAATRLNKKLRPKVPFQSGQQIGTLSMTAEPELLTVLEQNEATLTFDPAFLAKLASRFVSVNPVFPAEHSGATFSFPTAPGGSIAPDASQGTVRTAGVVELLQLGGGQVFWQEPWLELGAASQSAETDLEPTPAFPGKIGRVAVFAAAPGQVSSDPKARTVSDVGVALTLSAESAKELDDAFAEGQALFGAGELVGSFSFVAQGQ